MCGVNFPSTGAKNDVPGRGNFDTQFECRYCP